MHYEGNLIRPPSEADSILLQVTVGCSYNRCTFCGAYKGIRFRLKSQEQIETDLDFANRYCRRQNRVFLADGDVLVLSQRRLVALLTRIRERLPWISRISLYGSGRAIRHKSTTELRELKTLGLDRVYMGLESGCPEVLRQVDKGETAETMIAAAHKITRAGLFLSVTVLLGLGGQARSAEHALATAAVLRTMAPQQIAALTLMPLANTPLGREVQTGAFILPPPFGILTELQLLLTHLPGIRCQFHANHASSYLPLSGRLPKDRQRLLSALQTAIDGITPLVPDYRRAL